MVAWADANKWLFSDSSGTTDTRQQCVYAEGAAVCVRWGGSSRHGPHRQMRRRAWVTGHVLKRRRERWQPRRGWWKWWWAVLTIRWEGVQNSVLLSLASTTPLCLATIQSSGFSKPTRITRAFQRMRLQRWLTDTFSIHSPLLRTWHKHEGHLWS